MSSPMSNAAPIAFAGSQIDRADHVRQDPERLSALMNGQARLLKLTGLDPEVTADGELVWGTLADADPASDLVFLGLWEGRGCFAPVPPASGNPASPPNPRLWQMMTMMSAQDLATYGGARSLVDWHARHRFCARCGSATTIAKGGWQRNCVNTECKGEHFPRVDPVTIMLVECQGKLLLGRQPRFPPRFFSALAGFVEPGESIEEAVAREVLEEAGVRARDVTYVASQPWPFPSSLMMGCYSQTDDPTLNIDTTELEEARWFSREEVAQAMAGAEDAPFIAPPPHAIANHLLRWWLNR